MEGLSKRIHLLRKTLEMSMETFGNNIGITKSSISGFEKGIRHPSEQTLKLICSEFNVSYPWLTKGEGDMFKSSKTLLDKLKETYDLDDAAVTIIEKFVELPKDKQNVITDFIKSMEKN